MLKYHKHGVMETEVQLGTWPVSISYKSIPTLHQSAFLLWPLDNKISGAMYSVVPHKEFDRLDSSISLASPKSVSITWLERIQASEREKHSSYHMNICMHDCLLLC